MRIWINWQVIHWGGGFFWFVFFLSLLQGLSELAILDVVFLSIPLSLFISPLTCILLPLTIS